MVPPLSRAVVLNLNNFKMCGLQFPKSSTHGETLDTGQNGNRVFGNA